jgi:hypothetical protein
MMLFWYLNGKLLEDFNIDLVREGKKIILFGADKERNRRLFEYIDKKDILCIFDNQEAKWNMDLDGIPVVKPHGGIEDAVLFSCIYDWKAISKQAADMGYEKVYFYLSEEIQELVGNYLSKFSPDIYDNRIREGQKFKYIHLIPDEKFLKSVTEFIEYGFHMKEHFFVIYMTEGNCKDGYGLWDSYIRLSKEFHNIYLLHRGRYRLNLYDWEDNKKPLDQLLRAADKILFHSEYLLPEISEYFSERLDLVREKGIFIPWSGSVGRNPYTNVYIEKILQYARIITHTFVTEKESLIRYFPVTLKAVWFNNRCSYARLTEKVYKKKAGANNVLIAHSPIEYTKAMETLRYLEGDKKPIHIYCITSYGPEALRRTIEEYGREHFKDRFTAVTDYMDYKEYVEFLSNMDVAVFGMEHLSGRDTLELLFWLRVKVYLKPDSEAAENMKYLGYKTSDYYSVIHESMDEFLYNEYEDWNYSAAMNEFDPDRKLGQWRELYEYDWGK